jgi:uncharacterized membrane protein YebE (DUF533 family)
VDTSQILSIFIKGALGSRGRKRARRAARFLGGNTGFLSASAVLGAAGVAWGIYETMQQSGASAAAPASTPSSTMPPPIPGAPLPAAAAVAAVTSDDRGMPLEVLRIVRLAVSAARADGVLLPAERALILSHAREAGLESVVEVELSAPRPLSEIVIGINDDQAKRDLYILAFTIVRADEHVSGAERVYLAQLAHQLGLDSATAAALEAETASQIDATPDTTP